MKPLELVLLLFVLGSSMLLFLWMGMNVKQDWEYIRGMNDGAQLIRDSVSNKLSTDSRYYSDTIIIFKIKNKYGTP